MDETGIITFTVMPHNIASAQFAANGYKPRYDLDLVLPGYYIWVGAGKWDNEEADFSEIWAVYGQDPEVDYNAVSVGVWNYDELKQYETRTAFAASLRLKYEDAPLASEYLYGDYYPEYNEVASTYNVTISSEVVLMTTFCSSS